MIKAEDPASLGLLRGVIDIELTNRCNANCSFCPRDRTPHQGLMSDEVLEAAVRRVVELRQQARLLWPDLKRVSFCGLGDQLVHPTFDRAVRAMTDVGMETVVNTNAFLLDSERGERLIAAGVTDVMVNGGEIGEEYEATYQLPFERVRDNVERFARQSADRCRFYIVLVDHRGDPAHVGHVEAYWRSLGVFRFFRLDLINRAGALDVEGMEYERLPQLDEARAILADRGIDPACRAPFQFPFIGYDGQYYLCTSDWTREVSVGNVFDHSFLDLVPAKEHHVRTRASICARCTHDPVNRLAALLASRDRGEATAEDLDELLAALDFEAADLEVILARVAGHVSGLRRPAPVVSPHRRRIPVSAV